MNHRNLYCVMSMKTYRIFAAIVLCCGMCVVANPVMEAQTAHLIGKVAKKGIKETSKKAMAKEVVEASAKKTAKRISAELSEDVAQAGGKRLATTVGYRSFKYVLTESILDFTGITAAKRIAHFSQERLAKATARRIGTREACEVAENVLQKNLKEAGQNVAKRETVKTVGHESAEKVGKEAVSAAGKKIAREENERIVKQFSKKLGLSPGQQEKLIGEMCDNDALALLIHESPEFNVGRWLNTQLRVDKSALSPIARNTQYAGKNFYFHPALNKNMDNYLKKSGKFSGYTEKDLLELDKLFPNGVPYTKQGFPDFVSAGVCKREGDEIISVVMPNGHFTGNREKDFAIARDAFEKKYGHKAEEFGYIWHHLEGDPASMVLVDTRAHECCRHAGGHALEKLRMGHVGNNGL